MKFLVDQTTEIHYEVYGEGPPLLLLNGIMMSTKSWEPFIASLSKRHQLILLDFWDQGQSANYPLDDFKHNSQVDLINALLEHLNVTKISIFGISYGGEIAMQFALAFPEKIEKLLLFNTCPETSYWLEEVGNSWNEAIGNPLAYYLVTIPYIYSNHFFEKNKLWIKARKRILLDVFSDDEFMKRMKRLTNSSVGFDIINQLSCISCPTLVVGCEDDFVTPLFQQKLIHQEIKNSELVIVPNCGHAIMYEKPMIFTSLILGFLELDKVIEI